MYASTCRSKIILVRLLHRFYAPLNFFDVIIIREDIGAITIAPAVGDRRKNDGCDG